jgi:hypothetical protein
MLNIDVFALSRSDLNYFLYSEVGTGPDGMSLTVLSALARLGMDPWQEAERLAKLSRAAAIDGLARLIATMPASRWPLAEAVEIAARLVLLLPQAGADAAARPAVASGWLGVLLPLRTLTAPAPATLWAILIVLLLGAALAAVMTLPGHDGPILTGTVLDDSSAGRSAFQFSRPGDHHAHAGAVRSPLPHAG